MNAASGADICRVTVVGPGRRVDLALPAYVPFADLFPSVARYAGLDGPNAVSEPGGWVLQRLGEHPFPPGATPQDAGLKDGELLYLRPSRATLPALEFDDVADAIAAGVGDRPGRWQAGHARWAGLGTGAVALAGGAVVIARAGPPWPLPAVAGAAVAVLLLLAALAASRAVGDSGAGALLGCGAIPYAFLAGLLGVAHQSLAHLTAAQFLPAFAAVTLACVIAAGATGRGPLFAGLAAAGLLGVAAAGIDQAFSQVGASGAAVLVAVPALALTPLIPSMAFRLARVRLPAVPRDTEDLRADTMAVSGQELLATTAGADDFVTAAAAGMGLVAAVAEAALAFGRTWGPLVTCAALACALLLRSRLFQGLAQRLWLLVPGYAGLILLAAAAARGSTGALPLMVGLAPLLAGTALVIGLGLWLPGNRPSPFWGRAADLVDTAVIVSLVPLALEVAGVFGIIRAHA